MNEPTSTPERIPTGVPGLDIVLEGGLLRGGVYIIEGPPGAGKTILANHMSFAAAKRDESVVYLTLLAESHARMLGHLGRLSFFDAALVPDKVYYVSAFKVLEAEGIEALQALLRKVITSRNADVLVLDGLVSAEETAPSAMDFRKFIHELQTITAMTRCTALLLNSTERTQSFRPEKTMVDGVIELSDEIAKQRSLRHIQIHKLRGSAPVRGKHTLVLGDDGARVFPRVETQLFPSDGSRQHVAPGNRRLEFGIPGLDGMIRGGLLENSVTMLLGPSGSGKTILSLQFLAEGARQGQTGVYFGFYERLEALRRKSDRLKLGIREAEERGQVELAWHQPVEGSLDVLGDRLFELVRRTRAQRLVIDGMHGFQVAADGADRIRDVVSAIATELERRGVTALYTLETPELLGIKVEAPVSGLSRLTHNILLVRRIELDDRMERWISVLKLRDSDYDSAMHAYQITDEGIVVSDRLAPRVEEKAATKHSSLRKGRTTKPRATPAKKRAR